MGPILAMVLGRPIIVASILFAIIGLKFRQRVFHLVGALLIAPTCVYYALGNPMFIITFLAPITLVLSGVAGRDSSVRTGKELTFIGIYFVVAIYFLLAPLIFMTSAPETHSFGPEAILGSRN